MLGFGSGFRVRVSVRLLFDYFNHTTATFSSRIRLGKKDKNLPTASRPWAWVSCYRVRVSARVTYCLIILSILRQGSSRPRPEIFVLEVSSGSRTVLENPIPCELRGSIPNMELGHWVTGSVGHLGHLSRPGHRVISLTWCETRVFPVFEKLPKMQKVHLKC